MTGRGRPKKDAGERAATKTLRLYPEDLARLQRLMVALRMSEGAVVRRALEMLEAGRELTGSEKARQAK